MANVKIIIDKRRSTKANLYPTKIYVYHNRKQFLFPTGITVAEAEWNEAAGAIKGNGAQVKARNAALRDKLVRVEQVLLNLSITGELSKLRPAELKRRLEYTLQLKSRSRNTLSDYLELAKEGKAPRTQRLFTWAQQRVSEFSPNKSVTAIDEQWVEDFKTHLLERYSPNTAAQGLAWVSRALTLAMKEGVIQRNPCAAVKKPSAPTRKKNLTLENMRYLRDVEIKFPTRELARDVFMLQFYLIGINIADLYKLTEINNGYIEYDRCKTGTPYRIKVEPEAMRLIEKLRGTDRLINLSRYSSAATACSSITECLHHLLPKLSTNYARHTWATFANELDIPIETISHALGHKIGSPVTSIYIAYNQKKIDDANRKIIDYLNADLKSK